MTKGFQRRNQRRYSSLQSLWRKSAKQTESLPKIPSQLAGRGGEAAQATSPTPTSPQLRNRSVPCPVRPGVWWERVQATQQDLSQSSVFLCGLSADVHWCPESQPPPDLSESVISRPKTSKREKSKSKSKSKRDWPQRIKVIQQKKTVHVKSLLVLSQVIWRIKVKKRVN